MAIDPKQIPDIDCSLEAPAPPVQVWDLKIGNRTVPVATTCSEVEELFALLRK